MGQEAVEANEGEAGKQEDDRPLVQDRSQGQEDDGGSQRSREDRVEIPEERLRASVRDNAGDEVS